MWTFQFKVFYNKYNMGAFSHELTVEGNVKPQFPSQQQFYVRIKPTK